MSDHNVRAKRCKKYALQHPYTVYKISATFIGPFATPWRLSNLTRISPLILMKSESQFFVTIIELMCAGLSCTFKHSRVGYPGPSQLAEDSLSFLREII